MSALLVAGQLHKTYGPTTALAGADLAAIRLIGADRRAVLRMALGESLVPAGLGLLLGVLLYLATRSRIAHFRLFDVSVFPSDVHPVPRVAALVVATVVVLSAAVTLMSCRGVAVEPLGVFRHAGAWHGRLWWRLLPLAASAPRSRSCGRPLAASPGPRNCVTNDG
jgi:FtsX-like permease family protein